MTINFYCIFYMYLIYMKFYTMFFMRKTKTSSQGSRSERFIFLNPLFTILFLSRLYSFLYRRVSWKQGFLPIRLKLRQTDSAMLITSSKSVPLILRNQRCTTNLPCERYLQVYTKEGMFETCTISLRQLSQSLLNLPRLTAKADRSSDYISCLFQSLEPLMQLHLVQYQKNSLATRSTALNILVSCCWLSSWPVLSLKTSSIVCSSIIPIFLSTRSCRASQQMVDFQTAACMSSTKVSLLIRWLPPMPMQNDSRVEQGQKVELAEQLTTQFCLPNLRILIERQASYWLKMERKVRCMVPKSLSSAAPLNLIFSSSLSLTFFPKPRNISEKAILHRSNPNFEMPQIYLLSWRSLMSNFFLSFSFICRQAYFLLFSCNLLDPIELVEQWLLGRRIFLLSDIYSVWLAFCANQLMRLVERWADADSVCVGLMVILRRLVKLAMDWEWMDCLAVRNRSTDLKSFCSVSFLLIMLLTILSFCSGLV